MAEHWTLDYIKWDRFTPDKVDPLMLKAVKAASLVEYNATDYVAYLKEVFKGDPKTIAEVERWGWEEVQHGEALGRWAELADPTWSFKDAFARFKEGYKPSHFLNPNGSVRGSRIGELIARCVVECGTSSYYTALRDEAAEPVLKQIAHMIASDEFKHYRLFYDLIGIQPEKRPNLLKRLYIAATRVSEAEDDELASAFYYANVARDAEATTPYDRKLYAKLYEQHAQRFYRQHHIEHAVAMIAKAVGEFPPESRVVRWAGRAVWALFVWRAKPVAA
ncbi:MAG TPA: rubrerythrin family protein [Alphaproteobacteria bacterium]|nr:rubrerythrin family protein [Alphaproteobacteria bacterium]